MNTPIQNVTVLLDEHMTGAKRLLMSPVSSAFVEKNVTVLLFVPLPVPSIAYEPSFFEKLTTYGSFSEAQRQLHEFCQHLKTRCHSVHSEIDFLSCECLDLKIKNAKSDLLMVCKDLTEFGLFQSKFQRDLRELIQKKSFNFAVF